MNNILRTTFVLIFVFGFSSTYVCKVLWACDGDGSHSSHESCIPMVQTKAEGMNEKNRVISRPDMWHRSLRHQKGTMLYWAIDLGMDEIMEDVDFRKTLPEEFKETVLCFCPEFRIKGPLKKVKNVGT